MRCPICLRQPNDAPDAATAAAPADVPVLVAIWDTLVSGGYAPCTRCTSRVVDALARSGPLGAITYVATARATIHALTKGKRAKKASLKGRKKKSLRA